MQGVRQDVAPVKLDGKVLFYVRGISSFPAELRAATISKRLRKAASDRSILIDSVKIIETEDRTMVYAGKEFIMNIYDPDALPGEYRPFSTFRNNSSEDS